MTPRRPWLAAVFAVIVWACPALTVAAEAEVLTTAEIVAATTKTVDWGGWDYGGCASVPFSHLRDDSILIVHCTGPMFYRLGYRTSEAFYAYPYDFGFEGGSPPHGGPPEEHAVELKPFPDTPHYAELQIPQHVEYVYVTCYDRAREAKLYNMHRHVGRNPGAGKQAMVVQPWPENRAEADKEPLPPLHPDHNAVQPNILMIWVDSLPRSKAYRRMPETTAFLESLMEDSPLSKVKVFGFTRYATVGANSWPNTMAMFCNMTDRKMQEAGHSIALLKAKKEADPNYVEGADPEIGGCLYHRMKREEGYATAVAPQNCNMRFYGEFYRKPPLWTGPDHELIDSMCAPDFGYAGTYKCVSGELASTLQLEVLMKLLDAYNGDSAVGTGPMPGQRYASQIVYNKVAPEAVPEPHEVDRRRVPLFGIVAFNEFHYAKAMPFFRHFDREVRDALQRYVFRHGHNSIAFVLADHGLHYGKFVNGEEVGMKEHHVPLMYLIIGTRILKACPQLEEVLHSNHKGLFGAPDIYDTVVQLPRFLRECGMDKAAKAATEKFRGLLSRISPTRTRTQLRASAKWFDEGNNFEEYDIRAMVGDFLENQVKHNTEALSASDL